MEITIEQRREFIKTLKVGDNVAYSSGRGYNVGTVKRITPTGKVRLNNDTLFDTDGYHRSTWSGSCLYPLTDEIKASIRRRAIIKGLSYLNNERLTNEQLNKIAEITEM